ncbi:MAG: DNA adenine methylase [Methanotrichaceae archaeon]|nr:DNA adenine methylase [Methanotrichaceae archaeon]
MTSAELKTGNARASSVKPFLRWAGGKTWLLSHIDRFLPRHFEAYHEPFLGGAAVFFYLKQSGHINGTAFLSDINSELVDCYQQVRDNVEEVIDHLRTYHNNKDFYYQMRALVPGSNAEQAARFIYLNRTSFNGVYRVNLRGVYNVPYGFKAYKELFDYENLREASKLLRGVSIVQRDFEKALHAVRSEDLVFCDPPYTVAHPNNGFVKYNQHLFAWSDQERLAEALKSAAERGARYVLTNAADARVQELFGKIGALAELKRHSVIGGKKAKRELRSELVFFNSAASGKRR